MSGDCPDLGFLAIVCERCGASAMDGPMFPGRLAGEWLCEEHADEGRDRAVARNAAPII